MTKSVSIIAATFYGNRGAEAMLSTVIGYLSEHYTEQLAFNVFSYYPIQDRKLVNDSRIRIFSSTPAYLVLVLLPSCLLARLFISLSLKSLLRLLPASVRALSSSKAHLCLAGVAFIDGRAKFLPFNIATILPAMLLGVPVIKLSQATGPFKTWPNRPLAHWFLSRCHHVFSRGGVTQAHLEGLLGTAGSYSRSDDVAFLFEERYSLSRPAIGLEPLLKRINNLHDQGRLIIGLCPSAVIAKNALADGHDYSAWMVSLIEALVDRGYGVALYPNATRDIEEPKLHNNDLPILRQIRLKLNPDIIDRVVSFEAGWNAAQIHQILRVCDVHAVSRFHAMVGCLQSGIPVLVLGWSHKYLEVMELFNQADMVFSGRHMDLAQAIEQIDRLVNERIQRKFQIVSSQREVKDLARLQFHAVFERIAS